MNAIETLIANASAAILAASTNESDKALCADIIHFAGSISAQIDRLAARYQPIIPSALGFYTELVEIVIFSRSDIVPSYEGGTVIYKAI